MKQPMTTPWPTDTCPVAELFEPTDRTQSVRKAVRPRVTVINRKPTSLTSTLRSVLAPPPQLRAVLAPVPKLPPPQTVLLEEVEGTLTNLGRSLDAKSAGKITITLPIGMEHHLVNAATFKVLTGRKGGTLLRSAGDRWEIVEDDEQIDLADTSQLYKVGNLEIYS